LAGEEDGTQVQSSWFKAQVRAPLSRSKRPYLTPLLRVAEVTPAADVRGRLPHALGSCAPAVCPHTIVSWRSLRRLLPLLSPPSCPVHRQSPGLQRKHQPRPARWGFRPRETWATKHGRGVGRQRCLTRSCHVCPSPPHALANCGTAALKCDRCEAIFPSLADSFCLCMQVPDSPESIRARATHGYDASTGAACRAFHFSHPSTPKCIITASPYEIASGEASIAQRRVIL
jgi:hypothetical protein